ncbi:MAG TPA: CoA pyrophosphatase [Planctomycetota bacterium]|nr:CoA pyrophosphatase [Planctomycetota bacterium]
MSDRIEILARRLAERVPREIEVAAREQAAIAVILNGTEPATLDLLLIQRAECPGDPWSGHMALPGGRRDDGDVDLCATGMREAREETGVELEEARLLGRLDDLRPIRQSQRALAVRPFVYWSAERPELRLSSEVADAFWVPLVQLRAAATKARVLHRGETLTVPAFVIGERTVWGMTHRVLAELLELTLDRSSRL